MSNVIDLNLRRSGVSDLAHTKHASDTRAHLANTAAAMLDMLRLCSEDAARGALDDARTKLAMAAMALLGPGWKLEAVREE